MNLNILKPAKGSTHSRKRIGRGQGSGRGGTSTRGHKGAQSRSGYSRKIGFEGCQMPIQIRLPKRGFTNINRIDYVALNLDLIQHYADKYNTTVIDMDFLRAKNIIQKTHLVKVLSNGEITSKLTISTNGISQSALEKVEKAGGTFNKI